jgi:hypothetical protein
VRRSTPRPVEPPLCLECGTPAELVQSQRIYPRRPDLWNRPMWLCRCGAYTGCHDGTQRAKGRPAAKATRDARMAAHAAFDPLWRRKQARDGLSKTKARGAGYKWLGEQLGLDPKDCHIGEMDAATARRVVAICRRYR